MDHECGDKCRYRVVDQATGTVVCSASGRVLNDMLAFFGDKGPGPMEAVFSGWSSSVRTPSCAPPPRPLSPATLMRLQQDQLRKRQEAKAGRDKRRQTWAVPTARARARSAPDRLPRTSIARPDTGIVSVAAEVRCNIIEALATLLVSPQRVRLEWAAAQRSIASRRTKVASYLASPNASAVGAYELATRSSAAGVRLAACPSQQLVKPALVQWLVNLTFHEWDRIVTIAKRVLSHVEDGTLQLVTGVACNLRSKMGPVDFAVAYCGLLATGLASVSPDPGSRRQLVPQLEWLANHWPRADILGNLMQIYAKQTYLDRTLQCLDMLWLSGHLVNDPALDLAHIVPMTPIATPPPPIQGWVLHHISALLPLWVAYGRGPDDGHGGLATPTCTPRMAFTEPWQLAAIVGPFPCPLQAAEYASQWSQLPNWREPPPRHGMRLWLSAG